MENSRNNQVELSDIFRQYEQRYLQHYQLNASQEKAFNAIKDCRTQALGRHTATCDECGHQETSYNSCRNRHCPKCQYTKQILWVDKLEQKLLPTRYFHVVFTIPEFLNRLFYLNQRICYDLLFESSSEAIRKTTSNPEFLGAQTGCLSVLHTWGQSLTYHPHIHCLVPAGGLSPDEVEWVRSSNKFFVPVKSLSKIFRAIFVRKLLAAIVKCELKIPDKDNLIYNDHQHFKSLCYQTDWNVNIKKTFKGAGQVVKYLGRYTHKVAISNNRILSVDNDVVSFQWKDYRDGKLKVMQLPAVQFIHRFLQHILPIGYYKIRYFGILASVNLKTKLLKCYQLLRLSLKIPDYQNLPTIELLSIILGKNLVLCPHCHKGRMVSSAESDP